MKNPKLVEEALIGIVSLLDDDSKIDSFLETHSQEIVEEAFTLIEEKGLDDYAVKKTGELKDKLIKRATGGAKARQKVASAKMAGAVNKRIPGFSSGKQDRQVAKFRKLLFSKAK
jgi:hypothetical protein